MIWFACKQCGKQFQQPDSAIGSLVFCDCGRANRVPWESTVSPPQGNAAETSSEEPPPEDQPRRRPRAEPVLRDPAFCFNHPELASEPTCEDCGEHFCPACVVMLRGKTLCGPCKNYRLNLLQRPPRVSGLAIASLVLAVIGGPLAFCLLTMGRIGDGGSTVLSYILGIGGLLLPALALALGFLTLRDIEGNPRVSGRTVAITGAVTAVIGIVWSVAMMLVLAGRPLVE
jgi:hypothetical protein